MNLIFEICDLNLVKLREVYPDFGMARVSLNNHGKIALKDRIYDSFIIRIGNILLSKFNQISKNLYESQMTLNTMEYKFIHRESNSRLCYWAVCQGFVYGKRNVYLYQVSANVQFRGGYGWIHKADKSTRENAKIEDKNDQAEMKKNAFFSGSWSVLNLDVQDIFLDKNF